MVQRIEVGVLGKHPGYGDFVRHGVDDATADALTRWIDATLTEVRDEMKADWADFWDNGQELRFWLGRKVLGQTTIGIFRPSRDRVGRRYPLLLMAQGVAVEAPVIDRDQRPWDVLSAQMRRMQPGQGAAALLRGIDADALFVAPEPDAAHQMGPVIWAHHPEGNLDALLASAAPVDHGRAATQRSYWWSVAAPGRAPVWLAHPGLPQGAALAWCIAGVPMDGPVPVAAAAPDPAAAADGTLPPAQATDPFAGITGAAAPVPEEAFHSARLQDLPGIPVPSPEVPPDPVPDPAAVEVTTPRLNIDRPLESPLRDRDVDEASDDDWAGLADSDLPSLAMPRDGEDKKP